MKYKIFISKKVNKFIESLENSNSIKKDIQLLKFFKTKIKLNLDIKSMKGNWRGYYRLRIGKIRFIFKIVNNGIIFIKEANFRGKIY